MSCGGLQCCVQCPGSCARQLLRTGSCMHLHPSQPADVREPQRVCGGDCVCPAGAWCAVCRHHQHGRLRHQPSHTLWCAPERGLRDWCGIDQGIHQPGMRCASPLGIWRKGPRPSRMTPSLRMLPCHSAALRVVPLVVSVIALHATQLHTHAQLSCQRTRTTLLPTHTHNAPVNPHMFRSSASP